MSAPVQTLRMVIQAWHCDHVGHLNAGLYMQWLGDAAFSLLAEHGLDGESARRLGVNMAAVRTEIDFRRELKAGDTVAMETELVELAPKRATFRHRLTRLGDGAVAMEAMLMTVCLDLVTRRAVPIPAAVSESLAALLARPSDGNMTQFQT